MVRSAGGAGCRLFTLLSCVCVWGVTANLMTVLVNRVRVSQIPELTASNYTKRIDYRYVAGDVVDVSCISHNQRCRINIHLEHLGQHLGGGVKASVGLRVTLREAHNSSFVTCACAPWRFTAIANIKFVLQNQPDTDILQLKVNGLTFRNQEPHTNVHKYNYYYLSKELVTFECETDEQSFQLKTVYKRLWGQLDEYQIQNRTFEVKLDTYHSLRYEAHNKTDGGGDVPRATLDIFFNELPGDCIDTEPSLSLSTSELRDVTTLYEYAGDQLVVYEFCEGESVSLNCSSSSELAAMFGQTGYYLLFGNTVGRQDNSVTVTVQLGAADDNTTRCCTLSHYNDANKLTRLNVKQLRVVFRERSASAAAAHESRLSPTWILAVACSACLVVACVVLVACYMKKRHRAVHQEASAGGKADDIGLPPYSPRGDSTAAGGAGHDVPSDLHYADIDVPHYANILPRPWRREETPYAEVLCGVRERLRSRDDNYQNIYMNPSAK